MSKSVFLKIGELVESKEVDLQTGPFGTQLKASDYVHDGTPVINVRNIGYGDIRKAQLEYLDEAMVHKLRVHQLTQNDIVFGRKGVTDRHAFIRPENAGWIQGSDCLRLRLNSERVLAKYLSYYFHTSAHKHWMEAQCSFGATMSSLNQDIVKRISFSAPPFQTQRKIAAILSAYDDLIENNNKRIALLERAAEEIYREWFVRLRFPGHEGVRLVKGVPEGWAVVKLSQIVNMTMGQSPKSKFYNTNGNGLPFHQGVGTYGDRFPNNKIYCSVARRTAHKGDILFSVRAPVGRINIANCDLIIGRGLSAMCHKKEKNSFLYYMLQCQFSNEDMIGNGAIFASVSRKELENFGVLNPTQSLVNKFNDFASQIDLQIENLFKANQCLVKSRDLLLSRLISGKLAVDALDIRFPARMDTTAD